MKSEKTKFTGKLFVSTRTKKKARLHLKKVGHLMYHDSTVRSIFIHGSQAL